MRAFPATARDNDREVMRLELTGDDVETLELLAERLDVLAKVEEALDVVASRSPFILGSDTPTVTVEGATLVRSIVDAWSGGDADGDVELVEADPS